MSEDVYIEWVCARHNHKPKDVKWYQYVLYGGVALFILSLFLQNFLFSFFILCAVAVLFIVAKKEPGEERYALTTHGVRAGNMLYPHHHTEAYVVHDHPEFPVVILHSQKTFSPHIIIPLGDTDHDMVHEYFRMHRIPERVHERNLVDWVAERIGF